MIESVFLQDKENCLEFFASLSNESKVKDILMNCHHPLRQNDASNVSSKKGMRLTGSSKNDLIMITSDGKHYKKHRS